MHATQQQAADGRAALRDAVRVCHCGQDLVVVRAHCPRCGTTLHRDPALVLVV